MENSVDFIAGCVGGAAGVLVGHPFDTVKVRLQGSKSSAYRGTWDCFSTVVKKESFRGLYKGVTSPLYSLAAINAVVFGVQANVSRRMENPDALSSHFLAGAAAGFLQCGVCGPMELAKIKLQGQGQGQRAGVKGGYTGSLNCLKVIYQVEGIRGITRGMGFTILRETPSFGIYFLSYAWLCRKLSEEGKDHSTGAMLFAGGMAGCAAWICTYPFDVIKTRIQKDGILHKRKFVYQYSGYADCIRKSVAADGYGVFFKGLNATLLRAFPTNAATFTVVAWTLRYLRPEIDDDKFASTVKRSSGIAQLES